MVKQCHLKNMKDTMISIDKKDARILWNTKDDKITNLLVAEFLLDPETHLYNNQHLYNTYKKDIGNCLSHWDKMTNGKIIFHIFSSASTSDSNSIRSIFRELFKIKEFRQEFKCYMHWYFTDNEIDEYAELDTPTTQK